MRPCRSSSSAALRQKWLCLEVSGCPSRSPPTTPEVRFSAPSPAVLLRARLISLRVQPTLAPSRLQAPRKQYKIGVISLHYVMRLRPTLTQYSFLMLSIECQDHILAALPIS